MERPGKLVFTSQEGALHDGRPLDCLIIFGFGIIMSDMEDQQFETTKKEVVFFVHALAVDGFDLAIRRVPSDKTGNHAKVELVFHQNKGPERTEVVMSARMQLFELQELHNLIGRRVDEFLGKEN